MLTLRCLNIGTATVRIVGKNLKADNVRIDLGKDMNLGDLPEPNQVSDDELVVDVSSLAMGVHQVRVVHALSIGTPELAHTGPESNAAVFVIAPKFKHTPIRPRLIVTADKKLTIKVEQGIKKDQKVEVILGAPKTQYQ